MPAEYFQFIVKDKVQDVGFRLAIAKLLPDSLDVCVDNLEDGSVKVILKGEEKEVRQFYERLKRETLGKSVNPKFVNLAKIEGNGLSTNRFFHKLQFEQMEKFIDVGIEMRKEMREGFEGLGGKIDMLSKDMKGGFYRLGRKIDHLGGKMDSLPRRIAVEIVKVLKK